MQVWSADGGLGGCHQLPADGMFINKYAKNRRPQSFNDFRISSSFQHQVRSEVLHITRLTC